EDCCRKGVFPGLPERLEQRDDERSGSAPHGLRKHRRRIAKRDILLGGYVPHRRTPERLSPGIVEEGARSTHIPIYSRRQKLLFTQGVVGGHAANNRSCQGFLVLDVPG